MLAPLPSASTAKLNVGVHVSNLVKHVSAAGYIFVWDQRCENSSTTSLCPEQCLRYVFGTICGYEQSYTLTLHREKCVALHKVEAWLRTMGMTKRDGKLTNIWTKYCTVLCQVYVSFLSSLLSKKQDKCASPSRCKDASLGLICMQLFDRNVCQWDMWVKSCVLLYCPSIF